MNRTFANEKLLIYHWIFQIRKGSKLASKALGQAQGHHGSDGRYRYCCRWCPHIIPKIAPKAGHFRIFLVKGTSSLLSSCSIVSLNMPSCLISPFKVKTLRRRWTWPPIFSVTVFSVDRVETRESFSVPAWFRMQCRLLKGQKIGRKPDEFTLLLANLWNNYPLNPIDLLWAKVRPKPKGLSVWWLVLGPVQCPKVAGGTSMPVLEGQKIFLTPSKFFTY